MLLVLATIVQAQPFIAVHSEGEIEYCNTFQAAVDSAQNGDTLYLPGASFNIGTYELSKSLHIYGIGYFPDSCKIGTPTILNGNLRILTGADGGLLSGIDLTGNLYFGTNTDNQTVHNYTISRSRIRAAFYLSYNGSEQTYSTGMVITECIINNTFLGGHGTAIIHKCIFNSYFHYMNGGVITNSLFLYDGYTYDYADRKTFYNVSNCIFEACIVLQDYRNAPLSLSGSPGNVFNHCLFDYSFDLGATGNSGINNIFGSPPQFVYVSNQNSYSTDYNYKLDPSSPGVGAGTDGTDIGLYGTATPFKHVPPNPHVVSKNIDSQLSGDGELNVEIKVVAQDR